MQLEREQLVQKARESWAARWKNRLDFVQDVGNFVPWLVRCKRCRGQAKMWPKWSDRTATCKCAHCGAQYTHRLNSDWPKLLQSAPLWLKTDFRGHVFWAVNCDHLDFLEKVIRSLKRPPLVDLHGIRWMKTTLMPYNLPSWLLASKNREDLLRVMRRLRRTIAG